jgi:hypothetical protein
MGGRFGKYGDLKRRKALQRGRREKSRLERDNLIALRSRSGLFPLKQRSSLSYAAKSYKTAVVAIPPDHLWEPIQGLRKQYDPALSALDATHHASLPIPAGLGL